MQTYTTCAHTHKPSYFCILVQSMLSDAYNDVIIILDDMGGGKFQCAAPLPPPLSVSLLGKTVLYLSLFASATVVKNGLTAMIKMFI